MFNKITTFTVNKDDYRVLNKESLEKTAGELNLPEGIKLDPEFLYIRVRGVSAGEYFGSNKNADYFPEKELKTGYTTFLTAHTFKNHDNKDVANAIGDVLYSQYDDRMHGVDLILRISRKTAPSIVDGFEKGYMTDVSMGCRVDYSICSICGNKAKTPAQYCDHVRMERNRIYDDGRKVYEINVGPKFHDISAVLNGAEKVAKVTGIYIENGKIACCSQDKFLEKVASFEESKPLKTFVEDPFKLEIFEPFEKKASFSKKATAEKIAEIKKQIQSKLIEAVNPSQENTRKKFKLFIDSPWDDEKCLQAAELIKNRAKERNVSEYQMLQHFIKLLDFAGIELAPKEFSCLCSHFGGMRATECGKADIDLVDKQVDALRDVSYDKLNGKQFTDILSGMSSGISDKMRANPLVTMISISKVKRDPVENFNFCDIDEPFARSVAPMIRDRSVFSGNMINRINENHFNNANQYRVFPVDMVSSPFQNIINAILYSMYQRQRENRAENPAFLDMSERLAEVIDSACEKTASFSSKASNVATKISKLTKPHSLKWSVAPLATLSYSGIQRARMREGQNVGSVNRWIAEEPLAATGASMALTGALAKGFKKRTKQIGEVLSKSACENNDLIQFVFNKTASSPVDNFGFLLYDKDIFKDKYIDSKMSEKYSQEQIGAIKVATIFYGEDISSKTLENNNLSYKDIEYFLKTASDYLETSKKEKLSECAEKIAFSLGDKSIFSQKENSEEFSKGIIEKILIK